VESIWIETTIEMESVNWRGRTIHLRNVPAIRNTKTGNVRVYPSEVAKAEVRMLAEEYDLEPRDVCLLLMLLAKPGPFKKGYVQFKYQINKMLFYQWKEMEKQGLGDTFPHDEFEAAPRGPIPKNLDADLKRLEKKSIVSLSYKKWGKGPKEASVTTTLTSFGVKVATKLVREVPKPLKEVTVVVKEQLFPLDPMTIREKVHQDFPKYQKIYVELDRD